MLQHSLALKIVFANRLVKHHLQSWQKETFKPRSLGWVQKQSQFTEINCLHVSNEVKSLMMVLQQEIIEFFILLYE